MKKTLLIILSLISISYSAFADEVDPIGNVKTLAVTIRQLDQRALPNAHEYKSWILIRFGDQKTTLWTSEVNRVVVKTLTIPTPANGAYEIQFCAQIYDDYDQPCTTIGRGKVDSGVRRVESRLKRIDVHHSIITRQDGSQYVAPDGNVNIESALFADYYRSFNFQTGFGIDVPVGYNYTASVTAHTEAGVDNGYKIELDYRDL